MSHIQRDFPLISNLIGMFLLILVQLHFTTRFRSEVLYSNRLRQGMVASVMKRSGHLTTMAMFSMAGLAFFIGYVLKNVQFLMSQPPSGVFLIFFFITLSNFSSFVVIPSIR